MTRTILTLFAVALAAALFADTGEAKSRSKKPQRVATPATEPWHGPAFRQQPARMIEVKPGLWISSYGCVQDEGYGRFLACDITDGMH